MYFACLLWRQLLLKAMHFYIELFPKIEVNCVTFNGNYCIKLILRYVFLS